MIFRKGIRPDHLNLLYRQLGAMTASGMRVEEAIKTLAEEADDSPVRGLVTAMQKDVERGTSAGEALASHLVHLRGLPPTVFSKDTNTLSRFFGDIAEFSEKRQALRRFMALSFVYPALVAVVLLFVVTLLMVVVVPMLASMFSDMGQALPLPTRMVIALSGFLGGWGGLMILVAVAAVLVIFLSNRLWFFQAADKMPFLREVNRKIAGAELFRNLALMTKLSVPSEQVLSAAAAFVTNDYYTKRLKDIAPKCRTLAEFVTRLRQEGLVPALVSHTVRAGERSGTLSEALHESARFVEHDAEKTYSRFVVLLYPLTIILLGAIVGFIVIAMYMPIFQMGAVVG
jgi:type II secretory pathway component PulF